VRKLCPKCRRQDAQGHWHPVGCDHCAHTGYKGRTGVYELMAVDPAVQALVHNRAAEAELATAARAAGLRSMREDGERLVAEGITSLEELVRVTRESDLPGSEAMNRRTAARGTAPTAAGTAG